MMKKKHPGLSGSYCALFMYEQKKPLGILVFTRSLPKALSMDTICANSPEIKELSLV